MVHIVIGLCVSSFILLISFYDFYKKRDAVIYTSFKEVVDKYKLDEKAISENIGLIGIDLDDKIVKVFKTNMYHSIVSVFIVWIILGIHFIYM